MPKTKENSGESVFSRDVSGSSLAENNPHLTVVKLSVFIDVNRFLGSSWNVLNHTLPLSEDQAKTRR